METFLTVILFAACMTGISVGVLLTGRRLRGSCGGESVIDGSGEPLSCGACPRKESQVCPSDDPLVRLAQIGHPNPRHHR